VTPGSICKGHAMHGPQIRRHNRHGDIGFVDPGGVADPGFIEGQFQGGFRTNEY